MVAPSNTKHIRWFCSLLGEHQFWKENIVSITALYDPHKSHIELKMNFKIVELLKNISYFVRIGACNLNCYLETGTWVIAWLDDHDPIWCLQKGTPANANDKTDKDLLHICSSSMCSAHRVLWYVQVWFYVWCQKSSVVGMATLCGWRETCISNSRAGQIPLRRLLKSGGEQSRRYILHFVFC